MHISIWHRQEQRDSRNAIKFQKHSCLILITNIYELLIDGIEWQNWNLKARSLNLMQLAVRAILYVLCGMKFSFKMSFIVGAICLPWSTVLVINVVNLNMNVSLLVN